MLSVFSFSPVSGPGLISTSPAATSSRDSAKSSRKVGVVDESRPPSYVQHRFRPASVLYSEESPPAYMSVTLTNKSSSKTGTSDCARLRREKTSKRDP